jgi:hypothetical protein
MMCMNYFNKHKNEIIMQMLQHSVIFLIIRSSWVEVACGTTSTLRSLVLIGTALGQTWTQPYG